MSRSRPVPMAIEASPGGAPYGLSDYWRLDRSADRSRELTSIIGGAAALAELVQVRLSGTRRPASRVPSPVLIDPRLLSGFSAPIPSGVVDCVVGLAVREAALRALSADSSGWSRWGGLDEAGRAEFRQVHRALEEVYVSARLRRLSRVLGAYLRAMRDTLGLPGGRRPVSGGPAAPSRDAVLRLWLDRRLRGGRATDGVHGALREAVAGLDAQAAAYMTTRDATARLELAGAVFDWLSSYPRAVTDGTDWWFQSVEAEGGAWGDDVQRQMCANVQGGGESGGLADIANHLADTPPASRETLSDVRLAQSGVVVVTDEVRELGVRASATMIKDAVFDPGDYERVRAEVDREIDSLRHVFSRLDDVRSRWRYGLRRGRLDGRGLTRAAIGKDDVFKLRERGRGDSLALVFLVDVSASMRSYMPVVNRAACVVAEALHDLAPRVSYEVLTYTSGGLHPGAPVQLTRLAATGMPLSLREVWSDGGTPSGEAISVAMLRLRRRTAARKLVLHFTDGHPKDTYAVRQALEVCRRYGVDVLTVSVGASQEALYGEGKCEVAYSVPELISVLARLLPRIYR